MTLSELLLEICKVEESRRESFAIKKYGERFSIDIITYVFVKHCDCFDCKLFKDFDFIDFNQCKLTSIYISTDEVFSLMDYGPACSLRNESKEMYIFLDNNFDYWPNGTWSAPVLAVKHNKKLLVIDGNNRLRMLRCYIKHSNKYVKDKHQVNLITF